MLCHILATCFLVVVVSYLFLVKGLIFKITALFSRLIKGDILNELLKHKGELDMDARDKDGNGLAHYATLNAASK